MQCEFGLPIEKQLHTYVAHSCMTESHLVQQCNWENSTWNDSNSIFFFLENVPTAYISL